jgi:hypothetical protein
MGLKIRLGPDKSDNRTNSGLVLDLSGFGVNQDLTRELSLFVDLSFGPT